jgi:hypothetical protein
MRRAGHFLLLAVSLLFVAAGIGMVVTGAEGGWPAFLFFGVCAAVAVGKLWPGILQREAVDLDTLFARFPGPVDLAMDRLRMILLALGAAVFGGVVVWTLLQEPVFGIYGWFLWLCAGLLCLSVPVLVWMTIRGSVLRLTGEGFALSHAGRRRFTPWDATSAFDVVFIPPSGQPLVVYDDAAASGGLAKANAEISGRNSALPHDFGLTHEGLAALLNAWRERALSGR